MEPQDFELTPFGLSSKTAIIITVILCLILLAYIVYANSKRKKRLEETFPDAPSKIWDQLKENRSTIRAIIRRNIIGKYNNSYFGMLWNFIGPLILVIVIYLVFINVKALHTDRDYWAYICSGYFVVMMCRQSLNGMSFRGNGTIVKKLPTPPWIIALADTISNFITFVIPFVFILIFCSVYVSSFNWAFLGFLPLMLVIMFVFCFGLTMLFSTVTVLFGDVRQIMTTISRIIIWISPVFFYLCDSTTSLYQASMCNPFTYMIEPFHQMLSYGVGASPSLVMMAALIAVFFALLGTFAYILKIDKVRELI